MDVQGQDGTVMTKAAVATGLNFFQAGIHKKKTGEADLNEISKGNIMMADTMRDTMDGLKTRSSEFFDEAGDEFDPEVHCPIDLEKCHSDYRRFNSRYDDDELEINDTINLLVPSRPESSNILQFELILLESATIPRDYCVGWGVFPLVNSEF